MQHKLARLVFCIFLMPALWLAACAPKGSQPSAPGGQAVTPTGTLPLTGVENEIVAFELAGILESRKESVEYYQTKNPGMLETLPQAGLIIWEKPGSAPQYSNPDGAIQAWTISGGQAVPEGDAQGAIRQFHTKYLSAQPAPAGPWAYYEFSIVSVSGDGNSAVVFAGSVCGPTCGAGFLETLQKDAKGKWAVVKKELLWEA